MLDDKIAAFNFVSLYDLKNRIHASHSYLKPFSAFLSDSPYRDIVSIEYLTKNDQCRWPKEAGALSEALISPCIELANELEKDIVIGTPRTDLRVIPVAHKLGFTSLGKIQKCKYECELFYLQTTPIETRKLTA